MSSPSNCVECPKWCKDSSNQSINSDRRQFVDNLLFEQSDFARSRNQPPPTHQNYSNQLLSAPLPRTIATANRTDPVRQSNIAYSSYNKRGIQQQCNVTCDELNFGSSNNLAPDIRYVYFARYR